MEAFIPPLSFLGKRGKKNCVATLPLSFLAHSARGSKEGEGIELSYPLPLCPLFPLGFKRGTTFLPDCTTFVISSYPKGIGTPVLRGMNDEL